MDPRLVLDIPIPTDPQGQTGVSTFVLPIFIEKGTEGSENLEAKVKGKTGEMVKADEDWTRLSGNRSIDSSVVGGFMFQSDAGAGCSIQVTEKESLPVRILIDRDQNFSMFLAVVRPHEEWKTSGEFCLRFLRRVPVSDKQCTVGIEVPSAEPDVPPSDSGMSSTEGPWPTRPGTRYVKVGGQWRLAFQMRSPGAPLPAQRAPNPLLEDTYIVPVAGRVGIPDNDENMTDDEDWRTIGAAVLRARYRSSSNIPAPRVDHKSDKR